MVACWREVAREVDIVPADLLHDLIIAPVGPGKGQNVASEALHDISDSLVYDSVGQTISAFIVTAVGPQLFRQGWIAVEKGKEPHLLLHRVQLSGHRVRDQ